MQNLTGQMAAALIAGVLLGAIVSWIIAGQFRRRMVALMAGGTAPDIGRAGDVDSVTVWSKPAPVLDIAANRRSIRNLLVALTAICLLVGLTQSWIALEVRFQSFSSGRMFVLGAIYAWPMVLAWGLTLRWPWRRILGGIGAYILLMVVLVMLRSDANQTLAGVIAWLFTEVGVPLAVTLIIGASGRIRAVAPYLLPFTLILSAASIVALEALSADVNSRWLVAAPLVKVFGAELTLAVVAIAPWLLCAWPAYALGRRLAVAYRAKAFSDLGYLFAIYWFVVLTSNALPAFGSAGASGACVLLPWLWIPAGFWLYGRMQLAAENPPSLLVLRVFQRDAQVEEMFDQVIERWRFTGNTMLIAGTDLVSRTLDPDDLLTFLDRRLHTRFINDATEVPQRLGEFDLEPDPDGRYRVNDCYCRDSTWELALAALVSRADVVLMDLRGFQPHNRGCRHELGVLARAANLHRVVVLHDTNTAREIAQADMAGAPPGRFVWIEAGRMNSSKAGEVFAALFSTRPDDAARGTQERKKR